MATFDATTREQLFNQLDLYAQNRKDEIDGQRLSKDQGLIKSYLVEKQHHEGGLDLVLPSLFRESGWSLTPMGDDTVFHVNDAYGDLGFLDLISDRHFAIHSTAQSGRADFAVKTAINATSQLDFTWFAGLYFQTVWQDIIRPQMPDRFVSLRFEHQSRFETGGWDDEEDDDEMSPLDAGYERRTSTSAITERGSRLADFLPRLQEIHAPFKAIKMLRIPSGSAKGGYEFWHWGKVTHRSSDFRDGRSNIRSLARLYEGTTKSIEDRVWLQAETTKLPDGGTTSTLVGSPVTFNFEPPLSVHVFENFVETTFVKGNGPLRLQGNPLRVGAHKVQVYGVDLHLWQRVYLEITPSRMLVVLPAGTCGNTVHRLVTNIQRFLSPAVEVFVGDARYEDLIRKVMAKDLGVEP